MQDLINIGTSTVSVAERLEEHVQEWTVASLILWSSWGKKWITTVTTVLMCEVKTHILKEDLKNMFSGLNEMLQCEVPLEVWLSTVKLLVSEDR